MIVQCMNCRFWKDHLEGSVHIEVVVGEGICRLNGPVFYSHVFPGRWPHINRNDWCGDFEPKPESQKTPLDK